MRPPTPAVLARLSRADGVAPSIRYRVKRALNAQAKEAARRVAKGEHPIPGGHARAHLVDDWRSGLFEAKRPGALNGANDGYVLAERSMPAKSMSARLLLWRGKKKKPIDVAIGGENDFVRRMNPQDVDRWLKESSRLETDTSIRKYDELYEEMVNYRDPDTGYGLNPKQMARKLEEQGLAWSRTRSELMARTTSIWALNEGAREFYVDAGIAELEWMATEQETTCEICLELDGKTWPSSRPLFEAGDTVSAGGITLDLPFDIQAPPIHPYCLCALLPVL